MEMIKPIKYREVTAIISNAHVWVINKEVNPNTIYRRIQLNLKLITSLP